MKMKLLWILYFLATAAQAASIDSGTPLAPGLAPTKQASQAAHLTAEVLTRYHYKTMPLDDALSEKIYDGYLKSLDSDKLFFVQSDIDQLSNIRSKLDDSIRNEDLSIPFAIFNLYQQRLVERLTYARSLLKGGFNFQQKESYQYAREKEAWPSSETEMRELWRKRVKNDWLRLKLAGKDRKSIVEALDKRYENLLKRIALLKSEDAFQTFMNAYTMAIEPHTNYMGPRAAEDFDIRMKLSLVGIGAVLAEKEDYTTIRELVPGGPAVLSGKLQVGDRILGVAQGDAGTMTDVLGWRLDDTVALIRGAVDSVVRLDVLPAEAGPDGKHKLVSLIRKKITLDAQAAKKSVFSVPDGKTVRQVGVISLPTFYEDFEARQKKNPDYRSATRDVARLLEELKSEKVDSILIDLRNNGGGSLVEAIELTGLFIDKGPVVQQRNAKGVVAVESDKKPGVAWEGPLGVLINRGSASASEIFAAAIQDYQRGLIIGEQSFGKGTVQTMVNLDQIAKNDQPEFGELKMTVAQFFRINGGTTQLRGVTPDILFPTASDSEEYGEASFDNALPWMQINPAEYSTIRDYTNLIPKLSARHEDRVKKDKDFKSLEEDIAELKREKEKNSISLNEVERRKLRNDQEAKLSARDKRNNTGQERVRGKKNLSQDDGLQANERSLADDLANEKSAKDAKDVLLKAAVDILGDEVGLLETRAD